MFVLGKQRGRPPPDKKPAGSSRRLVKPTTSLEVAVITFDPPRQARILPAKFVRFRSALEGMGLAKQEFRAVGEDGGVVLVHPGDLSGSREGPLLIRRDIVEIVELEK